VNEHGTPVHLVDALLSARKPLPDGSLRVEYAQPDATIVYEIPAARAPRSSMSEIVQTRAVRFRLCRRIPIPISEVVAVARAYRDEAVRIFEAANPGVHSRSLTGREDDGAVAKGNQHIYYLPQPVGHGGEIAGFQVTIPEGISLARPELDALLAVERIRLRWNDRYPITVIPEVVDGVGQVPAQRWQSLTPFLSPHHHRPGRAETCSEQQVASCIKAACGVSPARITAIRGQTGVEFRTPVRTHEYGSAASPTTGSRTWRLARRFAQWFEVEFEAASYCPTAWARMRILDSDSSHLSKDVRLHVRQLWQRTDSA